MEILSEFPYACLLLLILFLLRSQERKDFLWAAILSGFLVSVRASGMMILPAILFWQLFAKRQIPLQKKLLDSGIFLVLTLSVFLSLNCLLFDIDLKNFISFYSLQFESNRLMVPSNFFSFFEKIAAAFVPTFTSVLISIPVLAIIVTGFYKKIKEREAAEWFFIFYLLLTAVYPYSSSGLRFIYPVLPLILIYFAKGFQTIYHFIFSKDNSFAVLTIIFCSSIILSFKVLLSLPPADGPHAEDAQTVLNYIREKLPSNAIVLFSRARAINLYCERRSTFLIQHKNEKENLENLKNLNCEYILYPDERSGAFHQNLQDFLMINRNEFDTVFTADRYHLLRLKSVQ